MLVGRDNTLPPMAMTPLTPQQHWHAVHVSTLPQPQPTHWEIPVTTVSMPPPSLSDTKPTQESRINGGTKEEARDEIFSEEIELLSEIYAEKPEGLITLLSGQLQLLKTEAQAVLALCGLAITVTGFSGGNVIRSGSLASNFLIAGIAFIIIAGATALFTLSNVKWITQMMIKGDMKRSMQDIFERRDRFKKMMVFSSCFLGGGLIMYLTAVSIAAVRKADQLKE